MKPKRTIGAQRWFKQAYYDLKAVEWNLEGDFYSTACFLAQQSAEVEMIQEGKEKAPFLIKIRQEGYRRDQAFL